ncbi:diguanylate cyclase [Gallaecimonas sp. GXIMD4217]|uniref:diguanylate cyclase domain-containing protein n=1 Tax=Gallaecimonas sp. GXIMD4217 TaxID=3131927 RepID=UPI00311AF0C7
MYPARTKLSLTSNLALLGLLGLLMLLVEYVCALNEAAAREQQRTRVLAQVTALRATLEAKANASIYLVRGLAAFLHTHPDPSPDEVDALLAALHRDGRFVRNIVLAPELVMSAVYPRAGNEAVLGVAYRSLPGQWPYVEKAVTLRETVLDGPVDLIQGGRGIINRTPVFRADGSLWGLISMVMDIDTLLQTADFDQAARELALYLHNPNKEGGHIKGDRRLLDGDHISVPLYLHNERWELAARPQGGWLAQPFFNATRLTGWILALLFGTLVYVVLREHRLSQYLAHHDALTRLPNRRYFMAKLDECLAQYRHKGSHFTLCYLDLNGFKPLNDRLGHEAGDAVLKEVAARLISAARDGDFVARIGGDEFVLLLPGLGDGPEEEAMAGRLTAAVEAPLHFQGQALRIGVSLGMARPAPTTVNGDELIRHADTAMYRHKAG